MNDDYRQTKLQITSFKAQWILLSLWGLMQGLIYPRANLWPLAYFCLIPLAILAVRGKPGKRLVFNSFVAGFIWWSVMISWLWQVTGPGYFLLSAYLSIYVVLFVVILGYTQRRFPVPLVIGVPLVWVGLEYLRGILITGFPWFLLGHSQPAGMIQIADFAGVYGVSFVTAMTSGFIVDLLTNPLVRAGAGRQYGGQSRMGSTLKVSLIIWTIGTCGTVGYGWFRTTEDTTEVSVDTNRPQSPGLDIGIVQTNVPQSNKNFPDETTNLKNFNRMMELSEKAANEGCELIVWPETMVPHELNDESYQLFAKLGPPASDYRWCRDRIAQFTSENRVHLFAGGHAYQQWQPHTNDKGQVFYLPKQRYNSVFHFDGYGMVADRYDKIHRVPFGEYIPWVESWPWMKKMVIKYLTPLDRDYSLTPGIRPTLFDIDIKSDEWPDSPSHQLATPICFEDVVSYVCREMVWQRGSKRVGFLVNLTNDGWYPGSAQALQHEQIARFRCVETRCPMVRAVNRGVSGFINSNGYVFKKLETNGRRQMVDGVARALLKRDPRHTLFLRIGDAFGAACLAGIGLLIGLSIVVHRVLSRKE